jgi:hypothetical protein
LKKLIKSIVPPILWDKLLYIRSYKHFTKYKDLVAKNSELKDKHKGKRCFILGSGPSIKKEDLKPLKNEIVFALNNFYVHEDFAEIMSGDVDKYYMTAPIHPPQTEEEWKRWFEDMESHMPQNTNMLFGLNAYDGNIRYIFEKYGIFKEHKINWYFAGVNTGEYYNFNKKDIDMTNMIWSANTVSIYALIAAIYMGFDEIYLLGMDHTNICYHGNKVERFYQGNAKHQENDIELHYQDNLDYKKNKFLNTYFLWSKYLYLNKFLSISKQKIYNLSSESLLDVFMFKEFKSLEIKYEED